ncbi:hypothetical protein HK104_001540, partial [Borealophlyctis nickersoniae]
MNVGDILYLITRYLLDFSQWCSEPVADLEDIIIDTKMRWQIESRKSGGQGDVMADCQNLVSNVALWNTVYMRFVDFIRKREMIIDRFADEFRAIEEENAILKDVLAQSSMGATSIKVTIRSVSQGQGKSRVPTADKQTMIPDPFSPDEFTFDPPPPPTPSD